jgi:hypothetical protein
LRAQIQEGLGDVQEAGAVAVSFVPSRSFRSKVILNAVVLQHHPLRLLIEFEGFSVVMSIKSNLSTSEDDLSFLRRRREANSAGF